MTLNEQKMYSDIGRIATALEKIAMTLNNKPTPVNFLFDEEE